MLTKLNQSPRNVWRRALLLVLLLALLVPTTVTLADGDWLDIGSNALTTQPAQTAAQRSSPAAVVPCINGMADIYPCANTFMYANLPLANMGGSNGNDIWGWTDPETDREYALVGRRNGTAFVDITDPYNPVYLGNLPTHTGASIWRDIKTYNSYAFVVSEAIGHGMQIFDLTQLRDVTAPPEEFEATAHYGGFGNAHNVVINEESGFAYGVGTDTCNGGLHMVNIASPTAPENAGCFSADGYTHDAQCVMYDGPDTDYLGAELCFNSNEDTLTIVNVSDKENPIQIARVGYAGFGYTHQGWLTEDKAHFLMNDELDEIRSGTNTRTYIWDVSDLDAPVLSGVHTHSTPATDHNLYVRGQYVYEGNYQAGLRILSLENINQGTLTEVAHFDTYPANDNAGFGGVWSIYPYFASDKIIIGDQTRGLFVVALGSFGDHFLHLPILHRQP